MKVLKRIAALALCLALVCTLLPGVSLTAHAETLSGSCGAEGDNLTWTLDTETGLLTIEGSGAMASYSFDDNAPWQDYAESITAVSFPEGLTSISAYAFSGCSGLTTVSLPESLRSIGSRAFASCIALTEINIPKNVWSIGDRAFLDCKKLHSVTIPANVGKIGNMAFGFVMEGITSYPMDGFTIYGYVNTLAESYADYHEFNFVALPNDGSEYSGFCGENLTWSFDPETGLLTIEGSGNMDFGNSAPWYAYHDRITKVNLPDGLTSIGPCAFLHCTGLTEITIPGSVSAIPYRAFCGSGLTTVSLPKGLLSIGDYAFEDCSALTEISLPATLTTIGNSAFYDCGAMKSVTIPANVTEIGYFAFGYVEGEEEYNTLMDDFTIYGYVNTAAESYARSNEIPFVALPGDASGYCGANGGHNLSWSLTFATGMLTIEGGGEMADFYPDPAPWYEYRDIITGVDLRAGVTSIGLLAFLDCTALTSVRIPESVKLIQPLAFENCASLKNIYVDFSNQWFTSDDNVLRDRAKTTLYLYPAGRTDSSYEIPYGITEIDYAAFCCCAALTEVTIPETVMTVRDYAFCGCDAMKSVTIPAGVRTIGECAFGYRYDLEKIEDFTVYGYENSTAQSYANENGFSFVSLGTIQLITGSCGDHLTWTLNPATGVLTVEGSGDMWPCALEDGNPWYEYRERIAAVSLPEGLTNVGMFAFNGCTNLSSVYLPDSVTQIEYRAFYGCTGLTDVRFSRGLQSIGKEAFYGAGLRSAELPEGLTTIAEYAFTACARLESVRIPTTLNAIGERSFAGCWSLRVLNLPEGLESIGVGAFLACESLTAVTLPRSLKSIGDAAFFACPALRVVTIPASATAIGYRAFGFGLDTETSNEYKVEGFTVCGYPGTAAETYATQNGFRFIAANRFADVTDDNYYFNAVMWGISHDPVITAGVDDTHFGAGSPCTREQIVTFLWKAAGAPAPTATSCDLIDVQPGQYYYNAVLWAKEKGITSGMGDGTFGVGKPCTRAQAMTFLWVAQGRPTPYGDNPFTDVENGMWYSDPVRWALENGITAGMGDGTFGVGVTCTRAQIITFLYKAFTLPKA